MIIGHLPSAYLAFKFLAPRHWPKSAMVAGIIGGVFPDIDMLWFHFVDHRAHHHHDYLTHRPVLYLGLAVVIVLVALLRKSRPNVTALAFCAGAVLHLLLDSVAGKIAWFWPLSDVARPLTVVQATHSHWLLSFANHWYFRVEIAVTLVAIAVFLHGFSRSAAD